MTLYGKDAFVNLLSNNPCMRGQRVRTDVMIEKRVAPQPVQVGQTFTYTLLATNKAQRGAGCGRGRCAAGRRDRQRHHNQAGSCALAANVVTCHVGDLAPAASVTIRIVAKANEPGALVNTARVRGNYIDLKPDNDTSEVGTHRLQPAHVHRVAALPIHLSRRLLLSHLTCLAICRSSASK